jgi:peptide/nickel transport system substrate-binding protein
MKKSLRYAAGILVVGLALTACSGPANSPDEEPQSEELVDFLWTGPALPDTTDPMTDGPLAAVLAVELNSRPVKFDVADLEGNGCSELPQLEDVVGELATGWEYGDDMKSITLTFRDDAVSNHGNPLTSEDVKWTFDRGRAISSTVTNLLTTTSLWADGDDAVEIVDEHTVKVNLKSASAMDAAVYLLFRWVIQDSKVAQEHATADDPWATEWLGKNSANFGPWQWTEADWNPGQELIMTRNPNYYAPDEYGNIGRVIMRVIPEGSTRAQLVSSGEVDYAGQLAPADYQLVRDSGSAQVLECVAGDRDTLVLQHEDERFADVRVRQAMSLAIDREELVQAAYQGYGAQPATDGLSQVYQFERPSDEAQRIRYDVEEAKSLLAEAGYPDGFEFDLAYSPGRPGPQAEQLAVTVAAMLEEIGITANIQVVASPPEFQSMFLEGRYEAVIYQEPPAIPDPAYATGLYSICGGYQNSYGYCDKEYDRLQKLLATTQAGPEREQYAAEISARIVETVPKIYLLDTHLQRAFSSAVDTESYLHFPYSTTLQLYTLQKN